MCARHLSTWTYRPGGRVLPRTRLRQQLRWAWPSVTVQRRFLVFFFFFQMDSCEKQVGIDENIYLKKTLPYSLTYVLCEICSIWWNNILLIYIRQRNARECVFALFSKLYMLCLHFLCKTNSKIYPLTIQEEKNKKEKKKTNKSNICTKSLKYIRLQQYTYTWKIETD